MSKPKILLVHKSIKYRINMELFTKEVDIVDTAKEADLFLCCNDAPKELRKNKCIIACSEPPLSYSRIYLYSNANNFHSTFLSNPDKSSRIQFPLSPSNTPQVFPYSPGLIRSLERKDTTITERKIYYAGATNKYRKDARIFSSINLYPAREQLVKFFEREYSDKSCILGKGWKKETKLNKINPRPAKQEEIIKFNCDFVLALENSMQPNYISEKIHDGLTSDRVTLYLGDPGITKRIPKNCFIDLMPYFDKKTARFTKSGMDAILNRIKTITQKEYDDILINSRRFRKSIEGKHEEEMVKLTEAIVKRIKG